VRALGRPRRLGEFRSGNPQSARILGTDSAGPTDRISTNPETGIRNPFLAPMQDLRFDPATSRGRLRRARSSADDCLEASA
jgi:hypothetical protein